jgi:spore germination protein KB
MHNRINVGTWESLMVLITVLNAKLILDLPRTFAEDAGTAGWILAIYVTVIAFLGFIIVTRLYKGLEEKDLIDVAEYTFGNTGRIIYGTIVLIFLTFIISVILREFCENMKTLGFTLSPLEYIMIFFVTGMIIAGFSGIEAIVRIQSIFVPIIFTAYVIYILMLVKYYDFSRIMPIMGNGFSDIFIKGALRTGTYAELIILFFLLPFLKKRNYFKKTGYWAILITGIVFLSGTITYLLSYQYPVAMQNFLPVYQLGRLISYGRFFQRVEAIFVTTWSTIGFLYLGTIFYFILYVFKKTFKLKFYKPTVFSFAIIIFCLALIPPNLVSAIDIETQYIGKWSWTVTFVLTILLLIAARIKKSKRRHA